MPLLVVSEFVHSRESNEYVEGLNSKVELDKTLGKEVEFKRQLHSWDC